MNNLKVLEYKTKRNLMFNQCFEGVETLIDEETKEVVYFGKGLLLNDKVVEKVDPLDEEFRKYCIGKYVCLYDKFNPKLSSFYKVFDLKYSSDASYPVLFLNKISANMSVSKNNTKRCIFIHDFMFVELEEILQITGWIVSKKTPFEKRFLYVLKNELGRYKIGVSIDVEKRVKALSILSGSKIEIVFKFNSRGNYESKLHKHFSKKRFLGEWFLLNEEDLNYIKNLDFKI